MTATIKFDGGARPNPGPSAIGYIVSTDDSTGRGSHHIEDMMESFIIPLTNLSFMAQYYCDNCKSEAIARGDANERHFEEVSNPKDECDGKGLYSNIDHAFGAKAYWKTSEPLD